MNKSYAPKGWHTITPRIFTEEAEALVDFVKKVFDASGDYEDERPTVLTIGDSPIMISTGAGVRDATPAFLYVYVEDADATYAKAIKAGAKSIEAPFDLPYGDRRGTVRDAFGNTWQIATPLNAR